jgi:glycosyltransferase involved in cell wall biosynthesis
LVPIESMACWTPVIAYKKWWALETIIDWKTWIFFNNQTIDSLNSSIDRFEKSDFDYKYIQNHALKFDRKIFKKDLLNFIDIKINFFNWF